MDISEREHGHVISHIRDFAEVESLNSQDEALHVMRQLSDRREDQPATAAKPKAEKKEKDSQPTDGTGRSGEKEGE